MWVKFRFEKNGKYYRSHRSHCGLSISCPGIHHFIWKHSQDIHQIMHKIKCAEAIFAENKAQICCPEVLIVGQTCNSKEQSPDNTKVDKILAKVIHTKRSLWNICCFRSSLLPILLAKYGSDIHHHIKSCHKCQICSPKHLEIPLTVSTPLYLIAKVFMHMTPARGYKYKGFIWH